MHIAITRYTFTLVAVGTLGASAWRVSTAPERIRARHEVAKQVCVTRGGEWVQIEREFLCAPASAASKS
jgi:hypothetical protein